MTYYKLAIFSVVMCSMSALVMAAQFRDCGSKADVDMDDIEITGCDGRNRCIFKKGEYANLTIPFTSKTPFSSLKAEVHGIINRIPIPFKLANPEACGRSLTCPVEADTEQDYKESMKVERFYPSIPLRVKWVLRDNHGQQQVCFIFPVKLQA